MKLSLEYDNNLVSEDQNNFSHCESRLPGGNRLKLINANSSGRTTKLW